MAAAQGAVTGVTGDASYISAPPSVEAGDLTNNLGFYVFDEKTVTLSSALDVDWFASNGGTLSNGGGGTISAGTSLTSYFVHFNPEGDPDIGREVAGNLTFSQKIIAVIFTSPHLDASDSVVGVAGTDYPTGIDSRKYENFDVNNSYLVDAYTLHINTKAWAPWMDQARVITAPVPVPAALWLFGSGVLAVLGFSRRKRREAALAG